MRELDNLINLLILVVTLFVVYVLFTVFLALFKAIDEINKILNQYPSSITFTPFNPESFFIGIIVIGIIIVIMKVVTD
jgi:hypothetical protein